MFADPSDSLTMVGPRLRMLIASRSVGSPVVCQTNKTVDECFPCLLAFSPPPLETQTSVVATLA